MKKIENYHDYLNTIKRLEIIGEMLEKKNFPKDFDQKKVIRDGIDSAQKLLEYLEHLASTDQ